MKALDLYIYLLVFSTSFDQLPVARARIAFHCKCDISRTNMPRDSILGSNESAWLVYVPFGISHLIRSRSCRARAKLLDVSQFNLIWINIKIHSFSTYVNNQCNNIAFLIKIQDILNCYYNKWFIEETIILSVFRLFKQITEIKQVSMLKKSLS